MQFYAIGDNDYKKSLCLMADSGIIDDIKVFNFKDILHE
jgi:hypothetical protein